MIKSGRRKSIKNTDKVVLQHNTMNLNNHNTFGSTLTVQTFKKWQKQLLDDQEAHGKGKTSSHDQVVIRKFPWPTYLILSLIWMHVKSANTQTYKVVFKKKKKKI